GEPGVIVASVMESLIPLISTVIFYILFRNLLLAFTLLCLLIAFVVASFVFTKGNYGAFFTDTGDIIPSLFTFIAVIGWVVYTMGGEKFPGWSALRYSTLSCLLGTATAVVIVFIVTLTGYISVPTVETIQIVSPHLLFMIIFPGAIALVGWNIGVAILSPLNGLLFINFVPVTTVVISIFQGHQLTAFDYWGTAFIVISLISNNIFLRIREKKRDEEKEEYEGQIQESPS